MNKVVKFVVSFVVFSVKLIAFIVATAIGVFFGEAISEEFKNADMEGSSRRREERTEYTEHTTKRDTVVIGFRSES